MTPLNRLAARLISGAVALVLVLLVAGCWCKPCPPATALVKGVELGVTVRLSPGQTNANPTEVHLSKTSGADHVRWVNETSEQRTLRFPIWPFMGPKADIVLVAGETSPWYTMDPNAAVRSYFYQIDPPLVGPGPPTEPSINEKP